MMMRILFILCLGLATGSASAAGPNVNIKYYGYDWLDFYENASPSYNATAALNAISDVGFSTTNLNVVHSIKSLSLPICAQGQCVLNVQAGSGSVAGSPFVDICPGATNDSSCQAVGSWANIWRIVQEISKATYRPGAIYFIDEPFDVPALQTGDKYVPYQYSSYLCTLRQAMKNYGLAVPVYTVLSYRHTHIPEYVNEIQKGAPTTACPGDVNSKPDWIGVDNYNWSVSDMWETYNRLAPTNNSQKWVLVPPSSASLGLNDEQLHTQIQLYWDFINQYPKAPVVYIMNWRFDRSVTENRDVYKTSTALLSFMANTILAN
ncbi:hypothetical protein [Serratia sp. 22264]|uniref:hypothetical protein n=1 Tax=Serratia sp. 22264 TaxID=3453897 RepID=UPI003F8716E8